MRKLYINYQLKFKNMRKKFTSLLLMLMAFVSTAMADGLTQNYYMNTNFWTAVEESSIPEGVTTVLNNAKVGETSVKTDAGVIQWACNEITVTTTGDVTVTFTHNGGNHMLNMLGVDVVNSKGNVVASDYHYDSAGADPQKTAYTLTGLTEGSVLTLRCFVYDNTGTNDRTNSAQGYYIVTNVTGEAIVTVKPAVNLANGKYIFREVKGDVVRYNGDKLARGAAFPDATDNNHIFTITKGNNGYYTIQTVDGKYVTYSATGNGTALATSTEATDANKWWSIREGSNNGLRIIVPSTNDVFNAPGWNYAINLNNAGANTGVGLWNSNGENSNWYIVGAPAFNLPDATGGYAQLKIANTLAYSDGTNIVKAAENNSSLFKFTKGEGSHFTIQDANGKYLIYTSTSNHLLTLVDEASATDDNKWWFVAFDGAANRDKALDIFPKQGSYSANTHAFNWSQNTNTKLGFWGANDNNSYCSVEFFVTPEVGSFVAFRSASTHAYASGKYVQTVPVVRNVSGGGYAADRNHTQLIFDNCEPSVTPAAVFEVVAGASDVEFKLKNVHTQEYVKSFASGVEHMGAEGDAVAISFKSLGGGQTAVYGAGNSAPMHAQQAYGVIVTWDGEAGSASAWSIEEVEVFSHTLSIGEIGWSSLILGFNTTIPQDVEVYAVSEVGKNTVTIEQITGVLPANTAVLVNAAKGDYEFTYTTETASVSSELEGTLYDNNVVGDAYVLSAPNSNVGLYKATKNQLENTAFKNNAFKAYLPATAVPSGAQALRFTRGGDDETTSIDQLINTDSELVIYDLAGRRVEKMEKGIYIVNGKKVIR